MTARSSNYRTHTVEEAGHRVSSSLLSLRIVDGGTTKEWFLIGDAVHVHQWETAIGPITSSGMMAYEGPDAGVVFGMLSDVAESKTIGAVEPEVRASFGDYHADDRVARPIMAQLCGVSERTAEDWYRRGFGPLAAKLGPGRTARVVYRVGDIRDWLDAQRLELNKP